MVYLGNNLQLNEQLALSYFSGDGICTKFNIRQSLEQKHGFERLVSLQRILQSSGDKCKYETAFEPSSTFVTL